MKQIKVLHKFRDKNNYAHIYGVGEVVAFDDERANDIVARGLGEFVAPKKETKEHKPSDTPAAPAKGDGTGAQKGEGAKETEEKNGGAADADPDGEDKEHEDESESVSESTSPAAEPAAERKAEETAEVHEPAAPKETKKPKSNGSRQNKSNKKAE